MKKSDFKKVGLGLFILFLFFSMFLTSSRVSAGACDSYKKYKHEYKNHQDKTGYYKIKWLRDKDGDTFDFYKPFCKIHKDDSDAEFEKLSSIESKMCNDFYSYDGYKEYLKYKNKCDNNNDDDSGSEVAVAPDMKVSYKIGNSGTYHSIATSGSTITFAAGNTIYIKVENSGTGDLSATASPVESLSSAGAVFSIIHHPTFPIAAGSSSEIAIAVGYEDNTNTLAIHTDDPDTPEFSLVLVAVAP